MHHQSSALLLAEAAVPCAAWSLRARGICCGRTIWSTTSPSVMILGTCAMVSHHVECPPQDLTLRDRSGSAACAHRSCPSQGTTLSR